MSISRKLALLKQSSLSQRSSILSIKLNLDTLSQILKTTKLKRSNNKHLQESLKWTFSKGSWSGSKKKMSNLAVLTISTIPSCASKENTWNWMTLNHKFLLQNRQFFCEGAKEAKRKSVAVFRKWSECWMPSIYLMITQSLLFSIIFITSFFLFHAFNRITMKIENSCKKWKKRVEMTKGDWTDFLRTNKFIDHFIININFIILEFSQKLIIKIKNPDLKLLIEKQKVHQKSPKNPQIPTPSPSPLASPLPLSLWTCSGCSPRSTLSSLSPSIS